MADETDTLGPLLADLAKYGVGAAGTAGANAATQSAYQAIIQNLRDRFGDYSNLKPADYKNITAQQLGPSALAGIQNDPQARADQQAAIAELDNIAKSGGLELGDRNALNELEQQMSRSAGARNASTANQYAARGQLGAGQQLAMELANNQHATENANRTGESIAAQAQKRAMEAVLHKGTASRAMSNDDYARKKAAAEASDAIARHNASMSTDAAKYNNTIAGQSYEDQLAKLRGQNQMTGQLNSALLGSGQQTANTIAGGTYGATGLIGALGPAVKGLSKLGAGSGGGGGGGGGSTDPDVTGDRGGPADLTGGDKGDIGAEPGVNYGGSNPDEYIPWDAASGGGG